MQFSFDKITFQQMDINMVDPLKNQGIGSSDDFSNLFIDSLNSETNIHQTEDKTEEDKPKEKATPTDTLNKLKGYLSSKGIDPDTTKIGNEGLNSIKKMLSESGADKEKLDSFFENFKANNKEGASLTKLFSELDKADLTKNNEAAEAWLPLSALANLQGILASFGLNENEIQKAFDGAKVEGKGIDLNKFIENLKDTMAGMGDMKNEYPDELAQKQIRNMLSKIEGQDINAGPLSMARFVDRLKAMLSNVNKKEESDYTSSEIVAKNKKEFLELLNPVENGENGEKVKSDHQVVKTDINPSDIMPEAVVQANNTDNETNKAIREAIKEIEQESAGVKEAPSRQAKVNEGPSEKNNPGANQNQAQSQNTEVRNTAKSADSAPTSQTLPKYVLNQVGRKLASSLHSGENQIKLQLKPAQLGRIHMSISEGKDGVVVNILTEQESTKDMLKNQANDLKTVLSEQGVKLDKVDIQFAMNFDEMLANNNKDSQNAKDQKRKNSFRVTGKNNSNSDSIDENPASRSKRINEGNLYLVA